MLSDNGHRPPEIRDLLLRLHGLPWRLPIKVRSSGCGNFFDLAADLKDEALDMLETITRLHETLSTLTGLRPHDLDDDGCGEES